MPAKIDLTGRRFGKLTVLYRAPAHMAYRSPGGQIKTRWICKCDCGREVAVNASNLMSGRTKSCGCGMKSNFDEYHKKIAMLKSMHPEVFKNG